MNESNEPAHREARAFWEAAVRLWEESGLSVRDFCSREGLGESSFHAWRRRFRSEGAAFKPSSEPSAMPENVPPPEGRRRRRQRAIQRFSVSDTPEPLAIEFLPVRVVGKEVSHADAMPAEAATGAAPIEIVGASPWRVRIVAGFDPTTLEAVLTVLERRPC